jgi:hypothetical protein
MMLRLLLPQHNWHCTLPEGTCFCSLSHRRLHVHPAPLSIAQHQMIAIPAQAAG